MKIGVLADGFRVGFHEGVRRAARLGAQGVQVYAVEGEISPEGLNAQARRDCARFVADQGMEICAICGDLGQGGFAFAERNPSKIERTKRIVDLALDMGCHVITTHIGVVPASSAHPRWDTMARACDEIGAYAQSVGACLAVETGPETAEQLKAFLMSLPNKGIRVNLDPGNLAMTVGEDGPTVARVFGDLIIHTHAKDGLLLQHADLEEMYEMSGPLPEDYDENIYCVETALGQGQVRFPEYLATLRDIGYDGYLTIEREMGDDPEASIGEAITYLKALI